MAFYDSFYCWCRWCGKSSNAAVIEKYGCCNDCLESAGKMRYKCRVNETVSVVREYVIEADSPAEAVEAIRRGDHVVSSRVVTVLGVVAQDFDETTACEVS